MTRIRSRRTLPGALVLAVSLGACAPRPVEPAPRPEPEPELRAVPYVPISPALPPIPSVEGPLQIRVVNPTPASPKPRTDSTSVWGSVGTGGAALAINGIPVPVAPNGAFVAFLPVPADGRFEMVARAGGREVRDTLAYAPPQAARPAPVEPDTAAPAAPAAPARTVFATPRPATVTGGGDTLATGSDAAVGRPTPTGTYRWFFPRGARLIATERRGDQYRVQLDSATAAWVGASAVTLADTNTMVMSTTTLGGVEVRPAAGWVDVRVRAPHLPFLVEPDSTGLAVTLYRATPGEAPRAPADPYLRGVTLEPAASGSTRMRLALAGPLWGYKAFYELDGTLVLRVRRPPAIDPAQPLRGIRIVIDPGHPPAGTTGPTGMREAESTLAIALPLAEQLRARGAEVHLTRTDSTPVELGPRTAMAVRLDAHLLVSVHNNAPGEGANPFRATGTSTYYFHPFSAELARHLDREIVAVTQIRDIGARQGNLALVRPTWMPSTLTESLFLLIPEQEAALRDPGFMRRLAEAHARGIESFLRARAGGAPAR